MRVLFVSIALVACAREKEAASPTLDQVAHAAFGLHDDLDALTPTVEVLRDWLDANGDSEEAWDGLRITNLTDAEVPGLDLPAETDLSLHVGVGIAGPSPFPVLDHASMIVQADQTFTDPKSFERYERTLLEGDAEGFAAGQGLLRTDNDILKKSTGVRIPYILRKDYRWVLLGDGRSAVIGRNWLTEPGCSDNGKNCVLQSFGLDAFVDDGSGGARRLYVSWIFTKTEIDGLLSFDQKVGLMALGARTILESTDAALAERAAGG